MGCSDDNGYLEQCSPSVPMPMGLRDYPAWTPRRVSTGTFFVVLGTALGISCSVKKGSKTALKELCEIWPRQYCGPGFHTVHVALNYMGHALGLPSLPPTGAAVSTSVIREGAAPCPAGLRNPAFAERWQRSRD